MERADALWPRCQLGSDRLDLLLAHAAVEHSDGFLLRRSARLGVATLEDDWGCTAGTGS